MHGKSSAQGTSGVGHRGGGRASDGIETYQLGSTKQQQLMVARMANTAQCWPSLADPALVPNPLPNSSGLRTV